MPFLWFGRKHKPDSPPADELAPPKQSEQDSAKAVVKNPDPAEEALEYLNAGNFVEARLRFLPMLRASEEAARETLLRPFMSRPDQQALAILDRAVTGAPNPGVFHLVRGLYHQAHDRVQPAVRDFDLSTRLLGDPDLLRLANDRLAVLARPSVATDRG